MPTFSEEKLSKSDLPQTSTWATDFFFLIYMQGFTSAPVKLNLVSWWNSDDSGIFVE